MKIYFEESTHTYTDDKGRDYASVSSVIRKYKKPFARDIIAAVTAKKRGVLKDEVIAEWQAKNEIAIMWGNLIHKALEHLLSGTLPEAENPLLNSLATQVREYLPKDAEWCLERIVASPKRLIAGTADIITINGKEAEIWDFKTNNLYKKSYNKLLDPLNHLRDDKITEYSLQLSLYAKLLEGEGYTVKGLHLLNIQNGEVEKITLQRLSSEIDMII